MKKKSNKSAKVAIVSTGVVIVLVGVSIFSLRSLSNNKLNEGLKLADIDSKEELANTNSSKLLSRLEKDSFDYVAEEPVIYDIYEQEPAPIQVVDAEVVVVDNVIDFTDNEVLEDSIEEVPEEIVITANAAVIEPETQQAAFEAPVAIAVNDSVISVPEEPVYEEPSYEEPAPVFEEPETQAQAEEPVAIDVTDNVITVPEEPSYEEPEEPVYEEPVYEEPEEPVYEEPSYEEPEEPVYEEPSYEEPEEPVYEEPVYEEPEEPAYEEPSYEEPEEPVYEEPSYEEPEEPVYEEPVYEEPETETQEEESPAEEPVAIDVNDNVIELPEDPSDDRPSREKPGHEEPSYEEPVYDEPSYDEPSYEEPVYDEPSYEEPAYEEPSYEEPVYEEPAYEEPVYEEPVYEEPASNASLGQQIANYASQWVGVTPYVPAGRSLEGGTDCSGFVYLVYGAFGIYASPASDDYQGMANISEDQLLPGDVVVYRYGGHVAIYAGDGCVIHAANEDAGTVYTDMYWSGTPTGFVRLAY